MAVLEKSIQDKIEGLVDKAYELYESGNKKSFYSLMEQAWNLYPEPRENWNESYNTARYAFDDLLNDGELDNSEIWYERMKKCQQKLGLWEGSYDFYTGKLYFAKGLFKEAKACFDASFKIGKGFRYFENEDPKYLEFYNNPEKYYE